MRAHEFITEAVKQRLDAKCWKGKHKEGTKIKGGVRVNNCVPNESVAEGLNEFAPGSGGDDGDRTYEYEVYQCNPQEQRDWIGGPVYQTDDEKNAVRMAHNLHKKHANKAFMVWQTNTESSLGGFGLWGRGRGRGVAEEISSDESQKTYNHIYQTMIRQAPEFMYRADSEDVKKAILKAMSFGKQISPHDLASYAYGMLKSRDINEQGMSEGLTLYQQCNMIEETAAWKRKEGKNKKGGLNAKGVASYRKENPGSKLQTAVTTEPSKLKPGSKDAKRRKSFCARMGGMKGPMKKDNGEPTRKALALRKWNCESVEHFVEMFVENMDHSKDNQAVPELKAALIARKEKLQSATEDQVYDIIDSIMTRIAKSHGISGQKLHDMWVKEYDQIPDTWIMK